MELSCFTIEWFNSLDYSLHQIITMRHIIDLHGLSHNQAVAKVENELVGISLCYDENKSYYIPINHELSKDLKNKQNQLNESYVIKKINSICSDESILKIGQNIKYDIRILNKYGVTFKSIADTMLISYSIDNGIFKHNLDDLSFNHLNYTTIKYKDVVGTGKNEITFDKVPIKDAVNYAAEDSLLTLKLFFKLYPRLIKERSIF